MGEFQCFFYCCPEAPQLSRYVTDDAGFLCDKASVLGVKIKETSCVLLSDTES